MPPKKESMKRKRTDRVVPELPLDIGLKIASSLDQATDVSSLACCSRFWREVSGYESIWESLYLARWGADAFNEEHARSKGWREFYVEKQKEMAAEVEDKLANYLQQVSSFGFVDSKDYLKALGDLNEMRLPFKEIDSLFFKPQTHVLFKLLGLHYCLRFLSEPIECIRRALFMSRIVNKRVCIRMSHAKKCRGFYHFVTCSLGDLVSGACYDLNYIGTRDYHSALTMVISVA